MTKRAARSAGDVLLPRGMLFCQCRAVYDRRCTMDEGCCARNNEIRDNITSMRRDVVAQRETLRHRPLGCLVLAEDCRHAHKTDESNVWNTSNACSCNGHLADGWNRSRGRSI